MFESSLSSFLFFILSFFFFVLIGITFRSIKTENLAETFNTLKNITKKDKQYTDRS